MKIEDYNKYYIQGSDHYLIPKDVFKELFNEMINWKEESKNQKEVIDKAEKILNECKLLMPHEFDWEEQVDNALDILKEVSE